MSSLRTQLAAPISALFVVFGLASSFLLVSELDRSLAAQLRLDIRLLWATFELTRSDVPGDATDWVLPISNGRRGAVIALDSTNAWPVVQDQARNRIAGIADAGVIPDPEDFGAHSTVGEIFTSSTDGIPRRFAVLVPTRQARGEYESFLLRLIALTGTTLFLGILLSLYLAGRLSSNIQNLTTFVQMLESDREPELDMRIASETELLRRELVGARNRFKRSAEEIAKLQLVRSQFLANVSHEVRTPLFSLKGYLETLLDGGMDDSTVSRQFLEKALHHAERIDNLLRDLIEISRIESGEMRMSFRFFRLATLFELVQRDHEDLAKVRSQKLIVELHDPVVEVLGDIGRLREVLANLIENALKYSPEGSAVRLTSEAAHDAVRISVHDSGPGIPPEHRTRIFERFYRVDPDRSRELGGTGLGLAIVKHIVEVHGAKVNVDSTLGQGTSFSFLLRTS